LKDGGEPVLHHGGSHPVQ